MNDRLTEIAREHFERGTEAFQSGAYRDAIDAYTKAIRVRPDVPAGYRARAAAFRALNDRPSAINDLSEAIRHSPDDAQLFAERAQEHYLQRSYQAAIDDCEAAMRLDPGRADVYGLRAAAHGKSGNSPMAMLDFEVAMRTDPDHAHLYLVARAKLQHELENWEAVVTDCSTALTVCDDHMPAFELRAMALHQLKRYADSERDFRTVLLHEPSNIAGLLGLGLTIFEQKRWQDGIAAAEAIIESFSRIPGGYELRGMCRENLFDFQEAATDFSKAIELNPKQPMGYHLRAAVYLKMGEWKKGIADHLTAFHKNPDDADSMNYLAWVWACVPDDSIRDGNRAVEFALRSCEATEFRKAGNLDTLAACYAEIGDWEKAVSFAEKAVELADKPDDKQEFQDRLELFRNRVTYRLTPNVKPA